MTTYFTSDLHFDHHNVIHYCGRPYHNTNHMGRELVYNWNSVVRPDDEVYILGDFSLSFRAVEKWAPQLNGTKYLVPGNHDWCHPHHQKSRTEERRNEWISKYGIHGLTVMPLDMVLTVRDRYLRLTHMPYTCTDPRYSNYVPTPYALGGHWLLHGHIHEKGKVDRDLRMINVGVDVWNYTPVSLDTILEVVSGGERDTEREGEEAIGGDS